MASFQDLNTAAGLKELNDYLLTRSYIDGHQASRDDLVVYAAMSKAPAASSAPHAARWFEHIKALLGASFPGAGSGVKIAGQSSAPAVASSAPTAPPAATAKGGDDDEDDDDDDDEDDMDFFGEVTPEEQAAADAKAKLIAEAKARGAAKAKLSKSMIIMDVKPWDDTTDMAELEKTVRAVTKDGLLWGSSKLVPVGFGIKKLQITCIIEDAKVESMDGIIEDELVKDGESEFIQSVDIAAFNKL